MGNTISDDELKRILLELLCEVDALCKENNITYFLAGGTLIGGVRHKGFIPWDDDIDLFMLREDYQRFAQLFRERNNIGNMRFLAYENDKKSFFAFGKVCDIRTNVQFHEAKDIKGLGVYIDVFPLDSAPASSEKASKYFKYMNFLNDLRVMSMNKQYIPAKHKNREVVKRLLFGLSKILGTPTIVKIINYSVQRFNHLDTGKVSFMTMRPVLLNKSIFRDTVDIEFEGRLFSGPVGWDEYLRTQYGDYMVLPPEEKRARHHDFTATWI